MHSQNTKARLYNKGLQHWGKYYESFCVILQSFLCLGLTVSKPSSFIVGFCHYLLKWLDYTMVSIWAKFITLGWLFLQIVNFGSYTVNLTISVGGLELNSIQLSGETKTVLTSSNLAHENSFDEPTKVLGVAFSLNVIL